MVSQNKTFAKTSVADVFPKDEVTWQRRVLKKMAWKHGWSHSWTPGNRWAWRDSLPFRREASYTKTRWRAMWKHSSADNNRCCAGPVPLWTLASLVNKRHRHSNRSHHSLDCDLSDSEDLQRIRLRKEVVWHGRSTDGEMLLKVDCWANLCGNVWAFSWTCRSGPWIVFMWSVKDW